MHMFASPFYEKTEIRVYDMLEDKDCMGFYFRFI